MEDDLLWVSITAHHPQHSQQVYARIKYGPPQKVTFYARPAPRWEGADRVYQFEYFVEWAPLETNGHVLKRSA